MTETLKDPLSLDLEASLKNKLNGEVRFDKISKTLYSTDASNYRIEPVGVVIPKTIEDVAKTLDIASKYEVAILPRGSGSSLAGQAVGHALIVDLSDCSRSVGHVLGAAQSRVEAIWTYVWPRSVVGKNSYYRRCRGK